jgi:FdhE protein
MVPDTPLIGLKRRRPEWQPWLSVVEEIVREAASRDWDAVVPSVADRPHTTVPLLAGAALSLQASSVRRLLDRLIRIGSNGGTMKMAALGAMRHADVDVLALFAASLCHDGNIVKEVAADSGVDAEALQALVALLPVPFLHACNRRWTSLISESWVEGYCPVCGSWPAFAEVRGIERSRCFRCGRCGAEWHARALHCPYCGLDDHAELVSLVPQNGGSDVIDACRHCLGYVKTLTRLQGCPPAAVMLEDLASVDLDVAALEQGYVRPVGTGCSLEVTATDTGTKRRFFAWNT